ncbi:MAG: hypothetical protein Q4D17_09425 [Planctomycetia bacterium]|nr:hypothetical protein [Planctomycetia bacterium]
MLCDFLNIRRHKEIELVERLVLQGVVGVEGITPTVVIDTLDIRLPGVVESQSGNHSSNSSH